MPRPAALLLLALASVAAPAPVRAGAAGCDCSGAFLPSCCRRDGDTVAGALGAAGGVQATPSGPAFGAALQLFRDGSFPAPAAATPPAVTPPDTTAVAPPATPPSPPGSTPSAPPPPSPPVTPAPVQTAVISHAGGCGWVPAGWNVPYGAVVLLRSAGGTIRPLIDALGERYTHSLLSLGQAGAVQAEMLTPGQSSWPAVCRQPVNPDQLRSGYPGVERIDVGAAYADIFSGQAPVALDYRLGDPAVAAGIARAAETSAEVVDPSRADPTQAFARKLRAGARIPYSLYQYKDIEQANLVPGSSSGGMVCATFLAYAHALGGAGVVAPYTYPHATIAQAANVLNATVRDQCRGGFDFWGKALLGASCPFFDVCGNAGDQVTNCMATNRCDTSDSSIWHRVRDDPAQTATSISPDRIAGLDPHGRTTTWSDDPMAHPVLFSSGGAQYGCWY